MMREDYNQHVSVAAGCHYNLQSAEIQWLRRTIHDKVKKMLHFPTSPVLSMGQYSECAMGCNCQLQEGVGPQKPNNLTVKHKAKLTFPEG